MSNCALRGQSELWILKKKNKQKLLKEEETEAINAPPHPHVYPPASGTPGPLGADSVQFVYFFLFYTSTNETAFFWASQQSEINDCKAHIYIWVQTFPFSVFLSLKWIDGLCFRTVWTDFCMGSDENRIDHGPGAGAPLLCWNGRSQRKAPESGETFWPHEGVEISIFSSGPKQRWDFFFPLQDYISSKGHKMQKNFPLCYCRTAELYQHRTVKEIM